MKEAKKNNLKQLGLLAASLFILNFASHFVYHRFDLTQDQRYTLSETTKKIIDGVDSPLIIDVFLEGNFPGEFKKLQNETRQLLEEFTAYNSNISFQFVNPIEKEEERVTTMKKFYDKGMLPINVTLEEKGKQTQEVVFPWALANYGDKGAKVQLLKNMMGASTEQKVVSSVQHLEYAFADAINKVSKEKQKKIAVIKGNGELEDIFIADFLKSVRENYYIGPITLDSVAKQPNETLKALKEYDLAIIAKPTEKFTDEEKQVLDQFIMKGGKTLWLVEPVEAELDSLYNSSGTTLAVNRDLNLADMFFKYGFRINPQIIKDEQGAPIVLYSGNQGSESQKEQYPWRFSPFVYSSSSHPIVKNIEGVKFEFASPIELLKGNVKQTVLLETSQFSKTIGLPYPIKLDLVTEETSPKDYANGGFIPVAILLEGSFTSMYKNRILPFKETDFKDHSIPTKMIVVSDGDIIKNQLDRGMPLELGFDKWTNFMFGNKEFLLNSVNFLLDDTGLINIRSKEVRLPMLDKQKVYDNYTTTQLLTVALPIVILAVFGFLFTYLRKKKYSK
ncbi:gliding motility-associated ABC transporter substrate-binding protein GldG [Flavobacterium sp.]|jgi:gliding-associated putative ABC transporter substrate-binding component GldG|uniref:gliding motility-associated ABC transporter substrate-binding protein GldG n=1 Tax=Flavobacterium sp. TaxID=239 RepID=UPI0037C19CE6